MNLPLLGFAFTAIGVGYALHRGELREAIWATIAAVLWIKLMIVQTS